MWQFSASKGLKRSLSEKFVNKKEKKNLNDEVLDVIENNIQYN